MGGGRPTWIYNKLKNMSVLDDIKIAVDSPDICPGETGNARILLHEIADALRVLLKTGESRILDLLAIPFGPTDEERLLSELGRGEVSATLNALGESQVWESRYSGVWVVEHRNLDGQRIAFQIEITRMPGILTAHPADIESGLERLSNTLVTGQQGFTPDNPQEGP